MKTQWDYTELAKAYLNRPRYAPGAIDRMVELSGLKPGARACDIGAGVAHLTLELVERGFQVVAVEPNDAMRLLGSQRTPPEVKWFEAAAEHTGQPEHSFHLATFGSSFNVVDRQQALSEVRRILVPGGWFACMWNHRDLDDPIQQAIERIIQKNIAGYSYGTRREDQSEFLQASGQLVEVHFVESNVIHTQSVAEVVEAWRSHATLQRQAGDRFQAIICEIESYLDSLERPAIEIPYTTRLWCGQLRSA